MVLAMRRLAFLSLVSLVALFGGLASARPAVREVRTHSEFKKIMAHHKKNTGLPVIVDFFSEYCGPCRMIAPAYKRLAKEFKDRAVFLKVDVNRNQQTSSYAGVRSMPTFLFYMDGKKKHEFSGADEYQLRNTVERLARQAERNNVEITLENLKAFYAEHASEDGQPAKSDEDLKNIIDKAAKGRGKGFRSLQKALKKKYNGAAPKLTPRVVVASSEAKKKKGAALDIKSLSTDALLQELQRRGEDVGGDDNEEDEEEQQALAPPTPWKPSGFPERVLIVGAGPAGLAAALYAARAGLRPLVLAPKTILGQLQGKGVLVENYPAVVGQPGPAIVDGMMSQASTFGAVFSNEPAVNVTVSQASRPGRLLYTVGLNNSKTIDTHTIIMATGASARWLGVSGEQDFRGKGVSTCATCDGFLHRDADVVVVGGGDTAMEDALVLARTSKSVVLIHRRDEFRASKILSERVKEHPKISIQWNTVVEEFLGDDSESSADGNETVGSGMLRGVQVKNIVSGETSVVDCTGAFVAIGHDPATGIIKYLANMDSQGYLEVYNKTSHTSAQGIFAAGDVADHMYRQAITSAGSGAMAALDAERYLSERGIKDEEKEAEEALMRELMEDFATTEDEEAESIPYPEAYKEKKEEVSPPDGKIDDTDTAEKCGDDDELEVSDFEG